MHREKRYREITLKPRGMQFVIDELPLLLLCPAGMVYGGMDGLPLTGIVTLSSLLLSLWLVYRFFYLRRIRYHIGSEQLTAKYGVFQRNTGYIELYRVVDFHEHQSLLQQFVGLKTVTVLSMDRTTPRLELIGMPCKTDIVPLLRERVEYNKQRKGIYEITNR